MWRNGFWWNQSGSVQAIPLPLFDRWGHAQFPALHSAAPLGRHRDRRNSLRGRGPLNPWQVKLKVRSTLPHLGRVPNPATGNKRSKSQKRIHADADTNAQDKTHELSDGLHRCPVAGAAPPAAALAHTTHHCKIASVSYQGWGKKQSLKD